MHEIGIVQTTLELAMKAAREAGASQIHCLRLRVGAMTGVVPDALQFAFEALRAGTMAENASLVVETVPVRSWCAICQEEFDSEDFLHECPGCHTLSGETRRGLELELASMEVT
jgi:hydrogenase nickel incorporation protein HypA/HybF